MAARTLSTSPGLPSALPSFRRTDDRGGCRYEVPHQAVNGWLVPGEGDLGLPSQLGQDAHPTREPPEVLTGSAWGVDASELGLDLGGVVVAEVLEDGEGLLPCAARGTKVAGAMPGFPEPI